MRGTGYAIAEIIWWMLAAAAVGFLIGWILRRWSEARDLESLWEERFEAQRTRADRLESELAARTATIAEQQAEREQLRRRIEGLQSDYDAKAAQLDAATRAAPAPPRSSPAEVEAAGVVAAASEVAQIDAERLGSGARPGTEWIADTPAGETPANAGVPPDKATATARVGEIAARTRGEGPRVDDDLKRIRGIGPKLEKLLKSLDITSFRQVASFTPEDITIVTAALDAFPGRIERDDWMSSAAEQHRRKYGESLE